MVHSLMMGHQGFQVTGGHHVIWHIADGSGRSLSGHSTCTHYPVWNRVQNSEHLSLHRCLCYTSIYEAKELWRYSLPARTLNISTKHLHLCQHDLSPFYNFLYLMHTFIFSCNMFWQCKLIHIYSYNSGFSSGLSKSQFIVAVTIIIINPSSSTLH